MLTKYFLAIRLWLLDYCFKHDNFKNGLRFPTCIYCEQEKNSLKLTKIMNNNIKKRELVEKYENLI